MANTCKNCGSTIGGLFGGTLVSKEKIETYKKAIKCPDELCTKCDGGFENEYQIYLEAEKNRNAEQKVKAREEFELKARIIPVVTVDALPQHADYRLIEILSFQSTLGTGLFSEIGSEISNYLGTEAGMFNTKMQRSVEKCKDQLRLLALEVGANAVIGADFSFSTNSRDATTVAVQGTAVYINNLTEVFRSKCQITPGD